MFLNVDRRMRQHHDVIRDQASYSVAVAVTSIAELPVNIHTAQCILLFTKCNYVIEGFCNNLLIQRDALKRHHAFWVCKMTKEKKPSIDCQRQFI